MSLRIVDVAPGSARAIAVDALVDGLGQRDWVSFTAPFHRSAHLLAAYVDEVPPCDVADTEPTGFVQFVVQAIGPDAGCAAVALDGRELVEAKVNAFGVEPGSRRRGIGTALQLAVVERARALGCWQVRSHSGGEHPANHRIKLRLGFGVHPIVRGDDSAGCYFVLPLNAGPRRSDVAET